MPAVLSDKIAADIADTVQLPKFLQPPWFVSLWKNAKSPEFLKLATLEDAPQWLQNIFDSTEDLNDLPTHIVKAFFPDGPAAYTDNYRAVSQDGSVFDDDSEEVYTSKKLCTAPATVAASVPIQGLPLPVAVAICPQTAAEVFKFGEEDFPDYEPCEVETKFAHMYQNVPFVKPQLPLRQQNIDAARSHILQCKTIQNRLQPHIMMLNWVD